jgi:hypothetical protein
VLFTVRPAASPVTARTVDEDHAVCTASPNWLLVRQRDGARERVAPAPVAMALEATLPLASAVMALRAA